MFVNINPYSRPCLFLTAIIALCVIRPLYSQTHAEEKFEPFHKFAVSLGHAHVREAVENDGGTKWLMAPSWGLDYSYIFHRKIGLGLHVDVVLEEFEVEEHLDQHSSVTLKRQYPVAVSPVVWYKPTERFSLMLGNGTEYTSDQTLFVTTLGAEYGWETQGGLEFGLGLNYAIKWQVYDTWFFNFIIGKKFTRGKKG